MTPQSFCESKYKRNMINGLIFRSWSLSSSFKKSVKSIDKLLELLHLNGYSKSFLERLTRNTVNKIINKVKSDDNVEIYTNIPVAIDPDKRKISSGFTLTIPFSEGFKNFKNSILRISGNIIIKWFYFP